MLTIERLKELLDYDPMTGIFKWKKRVAQCCRPGTLAGGLNSRGYWLIRLDRQEYKAHRLAWMYVHGTMPPREIDHMNGKKADNRIANLRDVSTRQNGQNRPLRRDSRTGYKGVQKRSNGTFRARIQDASGVRKTIGHFKTAEEAYAAYVAEAAKEHGEFANFGTERAPPRHIKKER